MIRRPPRSTQSRSSAASDVYKRQVDTFVIEWHQVKRYGTSDYETFEIITKRDNSIKIQYKKISNVNSATVGIENSNGTLGVQYICNGIGNPLSNESMIFYTTPVSYTHLTLPTIYSV